MHPPEVKQAALDLIAAGHNDCEVSRRLRIPRRTIADWRRAGLDTGELCPRCWKKTKLIRPSAADYAELLALYLGDGCISAGPRTSRLRIALDAKYRQIIDEASALLSRVFRANRIGTLQRASESLVVLSVYSSHLPCLLPQHAPGKKHERPISLEEWQQAAVESAPWSFIRGCVHTDGCSFINRTGPYEYLSYDFANRSPDIAGLFVAACHQVGVSSSPTWDSRRRIWRVRINQRASVAQMEAHIGLKR